jgi:hypothetical protein
MKVISLSIIYYREQNKIKTLQEQVSKIAPVWAENLLQEFL